MTISTSIEQGDMFWAFVPFVDQPAPGVVPRDLKAYLKDGFWGKNRPVVVITVAKYNKADEVSVASVTSNLSRDEYVMQRWVEVPLKKVSAVRPHFFLVMKDDIVKPIGKMHPEDIAGMTGMFKDMFGIKG